MVKDLMSFTVLDMIKLDEQSKNTALKRVKLSVEKLDKNKDYSDIVINLLKDAKTITLADEYCLIEFDGNNNKNKNTWIVWYYGVVNKVGSVRDCNGNINTKRIKAIQRDSDKECQETDGRIRTTIDGGKNDLNVYIERLILFAAYLKFGYNLNDLKKYVVNVMDLTGNKDTCDQNNWQQVLIKGWRMYTIPKINFNPKNLELCTLNENSAHGKMYFKLLDMFRTDKNIMCQFPIPISAHWYCFKMLVNRGEKQKVEEYLRLKGLIH